MKQALEARLKKLEVESAAALDLQQVVSVRWLTADEVTQGRLPGLYKLLSKDSNSRGVPGSVDPSTRSPG
jgi:hypothetical protein